MTRGATGCYEMDRHRDGIFWRAADPGGVPYSARPPKAMQAASELAGAGINVEVADLRVLRPLNTDTLAASVRKTHRAVSSMKAEKPAAWRPQASSDTSPESA